MPQKKYAFITCGFCKGRIRYKVLPKYVNDQPNRLIAIRRHYKRKHPKRWREIVKKAVRTRAQRRKLRKS